jgi:hypothetical protein
VQSIAKIVGGDPAHEPLEFMLNLTRHWKRQGGTVAGKPRHSDRYLDELLREQRTPIRSLIPKLSGRTKLSPEDARNLVLLFLSHWQYVGDPSSREIPGRSCELYTPVSRDKSEIEEASRYVQSQISKAGVATNNRTSSATASAASRQRMSDLIAGEFQKSVAMYTLSAWQTVLVARRDMVLVGFRDLMTRLWEIDRADKLERVLVWILDLGKQEFEDPEARLRFMNVEALRSRFKALKRFKDDNADVRWNWLQAKSVVVLHDTRRVRPAVPWLSQFDPHHVLFNAIPPRWLELPKFHELYDEDPEWLRDANYSIFLSPGESPGDGSSTDYTLRYFGNYLYKSGQTSDPELKSLKLSEPGRSYVEAMGTVYAAATQMLNTPNSSARLAIDGMGIERAHAIEKLQHHGFVLLRLEEFLNF